MNGKNSSVNELNVHGSQKGDKWNNDKIFDAACIS